MEDWQLLRKYVEQASEAAFTELMDRHLDLVYSTAFRWLGEAQAAEDVAQAVFCLLAKKARSLRRGTVLVGWLYQTTFFMANRQRDKEHHRRRHEQEAVYMSEINRPADPAASWEQVAPFLDEAMHQLKIPEQQALLLRFFRNQSLHEVGQALGISEDAARMRINRSLEKLRGLLLQRGIACPALGALLLESAVQATPPCAAQAIRVTVLQTVRNAIIPSLFSTMLLSITKTKMRMTLAAGLGVLLLCSVSLFLYNQFQGRLTKPITPTMAKAFSPPRITATQARLPQFRPRPVRTNATVSAVEEVVRETDTAPRQILVEIKFVEIKGQDISDLGLNLNLSSVLPPGGEAAEPMNAISFKPVVRESFADLHSVPAEAPLVLNPEAPATEIQNTERSQTATAKLELDQPRTIRRVSTLAGVITESQFQAVIAALEQRSGVDVVSAPSVTTLSGRQAQVAILVEKPYPVPKDGAGVITAREYSRPPNPGASRLQAMNADSSDAAPASAPNAPTQFIMIPQGPMIDVFPEVLADGYTLKLTLIDSVLDQIRFGNMDSQPPTATAVTTSSPATELNAPISDRLRYLMRQSMTQVTVRDGQAVVLRGLQSEPANQATKANPKKQLLIFATPRLIDPAGNRLHEGEHLPFDPNAIPTQPESL